MAINGNMMVDKNLQMTIEMIQQSTAFAVLLVDQTSVCSTHIGQQFQWIHFNLLTSGIHTNVTCRHYRHTNIN